MQLKLTGQSRFITKIANQCDASLSSWFKFSSERRHRCNRPALITRSTRGNVRLGCRVHPCLRNAQGDFIHREYIEIEDKAPRDATAHFLRVLTSEQDWNMQAKHRGPAAQRPRLEGQSSEVTACLRRLGSVRRGCASPPRVVVGPYFPIYDPTRPATNCSHSGRIIFVPKRRSLKATQNGTLRRTSSLAGAHCETELAL
jgi:hypothetical protein